jgi:hypothetical protein
MAMVPASGHRGGPAEEDHEQPEGHNQKAHGAHRPGNPGGSVAAHPAASPMLFPCAFRHNTTLQENCLQSVTSGVTKSTAQRTF